MLSWRGPGHPHYGGAEINTWENLVAWKKAGHNVVWFTSIFPGGLANENINGVEIIREGSQNFGVHIAACTWYLFKRHMKFDIVVDQFHGIPFFTPLYIRTRKVGFIHEVAREVWWLNPWPKPFNLIPGVLGSIIEPITFFLYRNVDFITVSNSTKSDLIACGIPEKNINVFLSGVNLNIPTPPPKKHRVPVVMFLGALSKDKGVEEALEVFFLIHAQHPKWQFWVVGKSDDEYLHSLQDKCVKLHIQNAVTFWGPIYGKDKFNLLAKSWVLINPSIREGWGLVNIEANAVGTPVVGYNVPGTRDSVRDGITGYLVPSHNIKSMADRIIDLIQEPKKYKDISRNSIRWAKQFSWSKFTKQSLALLTSKI